jgi:hypothetical protein
MKFRILSLLLLFSISLSAKKIPKWKDGDFKKTASGLQYKIVKSGKGDSIRANDSVVLEYALYSGKDKFVKFSTKKLKEGKFCVNLGTALVNEGFKESVLLLKKNGSGYFIIPTNDSAESSSFYFIRIKKVIPDYSEFLPVTNPPNDTVNFHIPDPGKKNYGDTLFTTMTLVEMPMSVTCHGIVPVLQAVKFRITYFENGVQHKDVLIFVECPDGYGKDFFIPGASYVITAIPLMENHKQGHQVQNSYTMEKLNSYYCLRIRKMN